MTKHNHTTTGHHAREQRQQDAQARQQARSLLTPKQQVDVLVSRPGASTREVARLTGEPSNRKSGKTKKQRETAR